jgi:hypothetical protein
MLTHFGCLPQLQVFQEPTAWASFNALEIVWWLHAARRQTPAGRYVYIGQVVVTHKVQSSAVGSAGHWPSTGELNAEPNRRTERYSFDSIQAFNWLLHARYSSIQNHPPTCSAESACSHCDQAPRGVHGTGPLTSIDPSTHRKTTIPTSMSLFTHHTALSKPTNAVERRAPVWLNSHASDPGRLSKA